MDKKNAKTLLGNQGSFQVVQGWIVALLNSHSHQNNALALYEFIMAWQAWIFFKSAMEEKNSSLSMFATGSDQKVDKYLKIY